MLQKRIIRIINKSKYDAHTDPIFRDLHVLKFHDICKIQTGQFVFSCLSKRLPNKFNEMFNTCNTHDYNTRSSESQIKVPFCRTKLRQFSVCYQGSKFYNSLPINITNSGSLALFSSNLKNFVFSKYGY